MVSRNTLVKICHLNQSFPNFFKSSRIAAKSMANLRSAGIRGMPPFSSGRTATCSRSRTSPPPCMSSAGEVFLAAMSPGTYACSRCSRRQLHKPLSPPRRLNDRLDRRRNYASRVHCTLTYDEDIQGAMTEGPFATKERKAKRGSSRISSQLGGLFALAPRAVLHGQPQRLSGSSGSCGALLHAASW